MEKIFFTAPPSAASELAGLDKLPLDCYSVWMHKWKILSPVVTEVAVQYTEFAESLKSVGFTITDWDVSRALVSYVGHYSIPVSVGPMQIIIYVTHESESQMTLWQLKHISSYEWQVIKF